MIYDPVNRTHEDLDYLAVKLAFEVGLHTSPERNAWIGDLYRTIGNIEADEVLRRALAMSELITP